ncbi:hypothetical protein BGW38_010872 [Lunasporangiospora selenospora]|uniref:Uncharacterized protein n=1 Tax=Lunasporangiospora selenospora TaxID=979761 RepID=A0A9P6KFF3_9FUNG|nr:hypothetical protein BGW38_010872 [Lunasporangiospora selenospora]
MELSTKRTTNFDTRGTVHEAAAQTSRCYQRHRDLDVHEDIPQHTNLLSECRVAVDLQYLQIRNHRQTYLQFVDKTMASKWPGYGETVLKEAQQDQAAMKRVVGTRAAKDLAGACGRKLDFRLVANIRKSRKCV